jgi:hypothetical protein
MESNLTVKAVNHGYISWGGPRSLTTTLRRRTNARCLEAGDRRYLVVGGFKMLALSGERRQFIVRRVSGKEPDVYDAFHILNQRLILLSTQKQPESENKKTTRLLHVGQTPQQNHMRYEK